MTAIDRPAEVITIPAAWRRGARKPQVLAVQGTSMEPDILDGDLIVVDPDRVWHPDVAVVARVGSENTLKWIRLVDGVPKLVPSNHDHEVIEPGSQDVAVLGVVVSVIRARDMPL